MFVKKPVVGVLLLSFLFLLIVVQPVAAQEKDDELWKKAQKIHNDAIVIDAHSHPMIDIFSNPVDLELGKDTYKSYINFVSMKKGGLDAFFFPTSLRDGMNEENPSKKILDDIKVIKNHVKKYSDLAEIAFTASDIKRLHNSGKRAVVLSIEYLSALEGNSELLESYHKSGVRSITLSDTEIDKIIKADKNETADNLSDFGTRVIKEMNRLGMLIDITHVPDKLQLDIIKTSKAPVIASHSCVRALNNIPRNIPDEILEAIAEKNGAVMISFSSMHLSNGYYKKFRAVFDEYISIKRKMNEEYKKNKEELYRRRKIHDEKYLPESVDIDLLIDHIDHAVRTAGIDHVGLGSDFIRDINPVGLDTPSGYPLITFHLLKRGYNESGIKKILGGNLLRILEDVQKISEN